ncbi:hypothetical protein DL89DRAFT_280679 [Linderina pennispora]|uniref:Spo11/DNA topoisomerase VI subunit A N-terminal domain-containing protein n=1 Tax=Linderina pennispora TaxID=61395 RepID=A0A1Y1WKZ4_9FUNG|nr:uncharacterized protein DL89DRAFT_280679 [Linderina pennispora]ORX74227.1 hypothetical protein DL89DRAFT_280679 [Linderina pennispora]
MSSFLHLTSSNDSTLSAGSIEKSSLCSNSYTDRISSSANWSSETDIVCGNSICSSDGGGEEEFSDIGRCDVHQGLNSFREDQLLTDIGKVLRSVAQGKALPAEIYMWISGAEHSAGEKVNMRKGLEAVCILDIVYQLLRTGQIAYQRDIYYRDIALFKSTANVRVLCNKIALYFNVSPARLNIIPCPTGLIYGNVSVELGDGNTIDYSTCSKLPVPHVRFIVSISAIGY